MEPAETDSRLATVIGAAMIVVAGVWLAVGPYRDLAAFHQARPCTDNHAVIAEANCFTHETGSVTSTNYNPGSGRVNSTYELRVSRASGEITNFRVDRAAYAVAQSGSTADLQLWHGDVAAITVNGVTSEKGIPAQLNLGFAMTLACAGLGMLLMSFIRSIPFGTNEVLGFIAGSIFGFFTMLPASLLYHGPQTPGLFLGFILGFALLTLMVVGVISDRRDRRLV